MSSIYTFYIPNWNINMDFFPSFKIPGRNLEETVLNQRYVSSWRLYYTEHSSSFSVFQPKFFLFLSFLSSCHFSENPWSHPVPQTYILLQDIKLLFLTYSFPNYKKQTRILPQIPPPYLHLLLETHPSIHNCIYSSTPSPSLPQKVCVLYGANNISPPFTYFYTFYPSSLNCLMTILNEQNPSYFHQTAVYYVMPLSKLVTSDTNLCGSTFCVCVCAPIHANNF